MSNTDSAARLQRLLRYVEADPANLALRKDTIREAAGVGEWETARTLIDAGLRDFPEDVELLAESGFAYLQSQRYSDAVQALRKVLARGIESAEVSYNLAFALFRQARFEEAIEHLSAPRMARDMPLALVLKARCLHHLRQIEGAVAACKTALAANPDEAEANGLLALLLYDQGCPDGAREHADAAVRREPRQIEALLAIASMQTDAHQFTEARSTYDTLLQADSACGRAWLGKALIELGDMRLEAAVHDIESAARHIPHHIGTWHVLAWTRLLMGEVAAAGAAFEQSLAVDRNFGETHGGLAAIAALQGREKDARDSLKRALRLDPQSLSARYAEMVLLQREGRREEVQAILDAVLERPLAGSDLLYRDLVTLQMKRMSSGQHAGQGLTRH